MMRIAKVLVFHVPADYIENGMECMCGWTTEEFGSRYTAWAEHVEAACYKELLA